MDIDYLLFLQSVRDATGTALPELFGVISKFAVSEYAVILMCFVYWVFDRHAGRRVIGGLSLGLFMNGLLKLIFCVYRPWIRDPRVSPYGDAKVAATGYSFPSGHATWATAIFGGIGEWLRQRGRRLLCTLFWIFVLLVMFSRNFLGVHTPQDVIVGFAATAASMFAVYKIEDWTNQNPKRDFYVMIVGLIVCVAAAVFFYVKSYPLDYNADGTLLVDPMKMANDSFQGIGLLAGYVVSRTIERRGFDIERLSRRNRLICAVVGLIPFYFMVTAGMSTLGALLGTAARNVIMFFAIVFYTMVIVPAAMSVVARFQNR